jgi:hypothetical protein
MEGRKLINVNSVHWHSESLGAANGWVSAHECCWFILALLLLTCQICSYINQDRIGTWSLVGTFPRCKNVTWWILEGLFPTLIPGSKQGSSKDGEKELPCTLSPSGEFSQSVSKKRKKKIREMPKGTTTLQCKCLWKLMKPSRMEAITESMGGNSMSTMSL